MLISVLNSTLLLQQLDTYMQYWKFQRYANFILNQANFSSKAGPALDSLKESNFSQQMELTYKKLDDHFNTAQETARQWESIKLLQDKSIIDIADFGKTFLESCYILDKNAPGKFMYFCRKTSDDLLSIQKWSS